MKEVKPEEGQLMQVPSGEALRVKKIFDVSRETDTHSGIRTLLYFGKSQTELFIRVERQKKGVGTAAGTFQVTDDMTDPTSPLFNHFAEWVGVNPNRLSNIIQVCSADDISSPPDKPIN